MALTVSKIIGSNDYIPGHLFGLRFSLVNVTFDASYPTGGEALDLQTDFGVPASGATVVGKFAHVYEGNAAGFQSAAYDDSNELLLLYQGSGAEVADTTDASSVKAIVGVLWTE